MLEPKYTNEQFIDAFKKAVEERGETFVYPDEWRVDASPTDNCQYFVPGVGGACVIGRTLEILGENVQDIKNSPAHDVLYDYPITAGRQPLTSESVACAARVAQNSQDQGDTWGRSLKLFEKRMEALSKPQHF